MVLVGKVSNGLPDEWFSCYCDRMESSEYTSISFVRDMKTQGIPEEQAVVLAEGILRLSRAGLATKADIQELDKKMEASLHQLDRKTDKLDNKIDQVQAVLQNQMEQLKFELVRWVIGAQIAGTSLVLAVVKLL